MGIVCEIYIEFFYLFLVLLWGKICLELEYFD